MTVTNCHGCALATSSGGAAPAVGERLQQGYNYPEVIGQNQQKMWFDSAGGILLPSALPVGEGCQQQTIAGTFIDTPAEYFHTGYDGNMLEKGVISENYVKVYVNNGGWKSMANFAQNPDYKSTIYYALCSVASNGTETCPTYISLGEFEPADNPFILITDIADGEYVLKVYSHVTTCSTNCPTVYSDSSTPLRVPFIVMTSPPTVSFTSTEMAYINKDTQTGSMQYMSTAASLYSGVNSDFKYSASTKTWPVYHSLFQVYEPGASAWSGEVPDNDDGKGAYAYSMVGRSQGSYSVEVLNVLVSNHSDGNTVCSTVSCHVGCASMCLSDFSSLSTFGSNAAYSAAPASRSFVYDSVVPTISANCKGSGTCEGTLTDTSMQFEFTCTDTNAPCTFYCAIDGKPTLDASTASSLSKGYTECTSPATVSAATSGSNTFTVYAVDAAGNMGDMSAPFTFYTDSTAPTVQFAGVAKRCLVDEKYFVPDFKSAGPASQTITAAANAAIEFSDGVCIGDNGPHGSGAGNPDQPDNSITGTYGSFTCTCGTHQIQTSATSATVLTNNKATFPSLMTADSDTSLNTYLGYYPKSVPDAGLEAVQNGLTSTQYLIDGITAITDSDGVFDFPQSASDRLSGSGKVLYDVGVASDTSDDISMTNSMYDTVVQIPMDITREVYNLNSGEYGAVLASKKVNSDYYYHILEATNSPTAKVNMQCMHSEIKNCAQTAGNPFQMDCGMMIT